MIGYVSKKLAQSALKKSTGYLLCTVGGIAIGASVIKIVSEKNAIKNTSKKTASIALGALGSAMTELSAKSSRRLIIG